MFELTWNIWNDRHLKDRKVVSSKVTTFDGSEEELLEYVFANKKPEEIVAGTEILKGEHPIYFALIGDKRYDEEGKMWDNGIIYYVCARDRENRRKQYRIVHGGKNKCERCFED